MKKIWAVSSGSYSDYRVECVCPDEKTAELVAARLNIGRQYDQASTEEMFLIERPEEVWQETVFSVSVDRDGNEVQRWDFVNRAFGEGFADTGMERGGRQGTASGQSTRGYDVALKIARDKLAELKASKAGV